MFGLRVICGGDEGRVSFLLQQHLHNSLANELVANELMAEDDSMPLFAAFLCCCRWTDVA